MVRACPCAAQAPCRHLLGLVSQAIPSMILPDATCSRWCASQRGVALPFAVGLPAVIRVQLLERRADSRFPARWRSIPVGDSLAACCAMQTQPKADKLAVRMRLQPAPGPSASHRRHGTRISFVLPTPWTKEAGAPRRFAGFCHLHPSEAATSWWTLRQTAARSIANMAACAHSQQASSGASRAAPRPCQLRARLRCQSERIAVAFRQCCGRWEEEQLLGRTEPACCILIMTAT